MAVQIGQRPDVWFHFVARTVPVRVEGLSMLVSDSECYLVRRMGITDAALESAFSTSLAHDSPIYLWAANTPYVAAYLLHQLAVCLKDRKRQPDVIQQRVGLMYPTVASLVIFEFQFRGTYIDIYRRARIGCPEATTSINDHIGTPLPLFPLTTAQISFLEPQAPLFPSPVSKAEKRYLFVSSKYSSPPRKSPANH
ncbi:hypothetical protein COCC4DRAFT_170640 [Bipolaris maydis ATCC 48331]|uniref:Uncharacterized protein n=2 Tax=Cochliobolus heterostrophus TaxID=5016 RepID=M2VBM5_COCH5|nr:uncharacterized protein COCC4DRAFT_170640 [Bipolaris maydis ATCC 48331]EMD97327.1 hypothetical protein COCHEDRAFT_1220775 [Bipolaris maydis C5]ENI04216.1 hypothetical protein COCC4DRAFT_170640 [Bipolaris maydis ATCC 48331]KAJ5029749.1 hypothetical protein J3E73DRAFT_379616 [Bipolaris maydis]KAJ6286785.1 hypothetical protein J3E71DRAFT_348554 [Bipolaris maydis]